jgi:hypothetical protein
VVLSAPGLVTDPRHIMTISPRLAKAAGMPGASLRIAIEQSGGKTRRTPASLVRTDSQTGLGVLQADDLEAPLAGCIPSASPPKDSHVFVVEPARDGLLVRRGLLVQSRAYLDQGRGKNPLLLVQLLDRDPPGGRSYSRWDDDLSSGAGAFLADSRGGFLGIVTPPVLEKAALPAPAGPLPSAKKDDPPPSPTLKEGEVLALPGEIARLVSESLEKGKPVTRGYLGASFREVDNAPEEVRRPGKVKAVRVEKVYPGGPADEGGLKTGDWLLAIEKQQPISYADVVRFSELVEYGGQGKVIRLLVARGNAGQLVQLKIKITLGLREGS